MLHITESTIENSHNPIGLEEKNPRISWKFTSSNQEVLQTAYCIQVSANKDDFEKNILWDSEKVESEHSQYIPYTGKKLHSRTRYYYRIKIWDNYGEESHWSDLYYFEMGLLSQDEWKSQWITPEINDSRRKPHFVFYFRKQFFNNKPIVKARIYASALGLYEIYLNGERVGNQYFTPGCTTYKKHLQYQVYEIPVKDIINENIIGIILSEGWYRGRYGLMFFPKMNRSGAIIFQMVLTHPDGTETLILSDETWNVNTGPILESGIYDGEVYDARLETPWLEAGFNDKDWKSVKIYPNPKIPFFNASLGEKVKKIEEIEPIEVKKSPKEDTIINMGQNMVGWLKIKLKNTKPGQKVIFHHGELLTTEGELYKENLRSAKARLEYTCKGDEEEIYEPHFTFMGFQYVKVIGYEQVDIDTVTGVVIHSDMRRTGTFECSHPLLNQLQHNIVWGLKGNFLDIPTDCPQRNERLGWTGDAQIFAPTANFIMDTNRFFTKWLKDLKLEQKKSGTIPPVIPNVIPIPFTDGSAGWADAATIIPYQLYLDYGDSWILEQQYNSMKKWVDYCVKRAKKNKQKHNKNLKKVDKSIDDYIILSGFHFGDWLAPNEGKKEWFAKSPWIATAFFAYSTHIVAKTAEILGKDKDAEYYSGLFQKIKHAFQVKFLGEDGSIYNGFQTAYALALKFGLIPHELKKKTAHILAEDIKKHENHLTTGFLGTPFLTFALSENAQLGTAYDLLLQETCPSWLYPVKMGATTIWERWDGVFRDGSINRGGINDPRDMCSFNHYAYGAIGDWLYKIVAGLNYDENEPGYKQIVIKPHPGGGLTFAKVSLESRYGLIRSSWNLNGNEFFLEVTIPPNTTAKIKLPDGSNPIYIGSGTYQYKCTLEKLM